MICEQDDSVLVPIDIQEKLCSIMPERVLSRILNNGAKLLHGAQILDIPILCSLQYPQGLGPLHQTLDEVLSTEVQRIEKTTFSCYAAPAFREALEAYQRKMVCLWGMEAHICVLQTALDLRQAGYTVFVVVDAICSRKREHYEHSLHRFNGTGIALATTESLLFEWIRDSKHPHFKEFAKLL